MLTARAVVGQALEQQRRINVIAMHQRVALTSPLDFLKTFGLRQDEVATAIQAERDKLSALFVILAAVCGEAANDPR